MTNGTSACRSLRRFDTSAQWDAALAAYDALLQQSPANVGYQRGRLEALRNLGLFDNVAMLVRAALPPPTARPDAASRELLALVPSERAACLVSDDDR